MITKAYLQKSKQNDFEVEEQKIEDELKRKGIPYSLFTEKQITRNQLDLTNTTLVAGNLNCINAALRYLNIPVPTFSDYPNSLSHLLYRRIWRSNYKNLLEGLNNGCKPVFAKPFNKHKYFTGKVFSAPHDLTNSSISRGTELVCSDVVNWLSEYRVYIANSTIKSIDHYEGDKQVKINETVVQNAINALDQNGESFAGYTLDFGVLENGNTALIEFNDGYSVGSYSISSKDYTEMIISRWVELLKTSNG